MFTLLAAAALAQAAPLVRAEPSDTCEDESRCISTGPAELFALADKLYKAGDFPAAAGVLEALTQDAHIELRSEARFRLAAVRERMGNLEGAALALRELLAEQPRAQAARLELARILSRLGQTKAARAEVAIVQAQGLPEDVEQIVRRFSSSLRSGKRRGISIELTNGFDSNINRSTNSRYVDTIIAPFELDPDARRRSGLGWSIGGQGFVRSEMLGMDLLVRVGGNADLFTISRFNDIQFSLESGPELTGRYGRIRPALTHERRWYGGRAYSSGTGLSLNWVRRLGSHNEVEVNGSRVRQDVEGARLQGGWRSAAAFHLTRALGATASARLSLRYAVLDARLRQFGLRQVGASLFAAESFGFGSVFGQLEYTKTSGLEPVFLFGKARREHRIEATAGLVLPSLNVAGFAPLVRATHSNNRANIAIYDYTRTRIDFGIARSF